MMFWECAGKPAIKSKNEKKVGNCACCGIRIVEGVKTEDIVGSAFARQTQMMNGSHICKGCAWMCEDSVQKNRNVLAVGDEIFWPMIGDSMATEDRQTWISLLKKIVEYDLNTSALGVLTTDPKPRLWPMAMKCTVGDFGLYVHCPDYDLSNFLRFDLKECLMISEKISNLLSLGYSKKACYFGLFADIKKLKKSIDAVIAHEKELLILRKSDAFIPALLISIKHHA